MEAAQFDEYEVRGSLSGPLVDGLLGVRLSGYYWDNQGQYVNEVTSTHIGGGDGHGLAATINFDPIDNLHFKGRFEYSIDKYEPRAVVEIIEDELLAIPADLVIPAEVTTLVARNNSRYGDADGFAVNLSDNPRTPGKDFPGNEIEIFRGSLIATWDDVLSGTITSYSGYLQADTLEHTDQDFQALPFGAVRTEDGGTQPFFFPQTLSSAGPGRDQLLAGDETFVLEDVEIMSQELRYASDWSDMPFFGDSFQMTLGLQYWMNQKNIDSRGHFVNCWQEAPGTGSFFPINPVCQDADFDDDPESGPIDTWQEVFLNNEELGLNVGPPQKVRSVHKSAYILLEWDLEQLGLDTWKLSFENRYSAENFFIRRYATNPCSFVGVGFPGPVPLCNDREGGPVVGGMPSPDGIPDGFLLAEGEKNSFYHTPKVTLEWRPTDNMMIFFSAAHAKKPAGIEQLPPSGQAITNIVEEFSFDTEKLNNYELGLKSSWQGGFGDLVFNGTVFYEGFSDKQVSVQRQDGPNLTRVTLNAGAARVIGTEFDFVWETSLEGLTFAGGYTWLPEAEYKVFDDITDSGFDIIGTGNCTINATDPTKCDVSFGGKRLEMAPKHAFTLRGSYTRPLFNSGIDWFFEGDAQYLGERFDDVDNLTIFDSYHQLDLRTGLTTDNWEILVFVENVTNNDTFRNGSVGGGAPDFVSLASIFGQTSFGGLLAGDPVATGFVSHDFLLMPPKRQFGIRASLRY